MSRAATEALVSRLVADAPALGRLQSKHIADNFGEALPHVFFADITRFIEASMSSPDVRAQRDAGRVLADLEEAMSSQDSDVVELVSVAFLENLEQRAPGYQRLRAALGPKLRKELSFYESR